MHSDDRQIRAVDCTAHVNAARQRNPQFSREFHAGEVTIEFVHEGFYDGGTIRRRAVAMSPSLSVNNIGNGVSYPPHREANLFGCFNDGLHILFIRGEEFDVVPARKSEVAITILIGNLTDVPDEVDADEPRRTDPYGIKLIAALSDMSENTWFEYLVVFPATVIFLDDLRNHLTKIRGANICFGHDNLLLNRLKV